MAKAKEEINKNLGGWNWEIGVGQEWRMRNSANNCNRKQSV